MQVVHERLAHWLNSSAAEAPYLLVGQDEGALEAATTYARQVLGCTAATKPCGTCPGCSQAVNGSHPDITVLDNEGKNITVKEVRACLERLRTTSMHGRRLVVIPHAERLSAPAVSALLKKLEEPATTTRFLLWSAFRRRILKTILSRCQILPVGRNSEAAQAVGDMPEFGVHKETLTEEELAFITAHLQATLKEQGHSPALVQAYMRLKDYYKIRSIKGNEKLAGQVLLATLEQMKSSAVS